MASHNREHILTGALALLTAAAGGCDKDLTPELPVATVSVDIVYPEGTDPSEVTDETIIFSNINNGARTEVTGGERITLLPGLYDVTYSGKARLHNGLTAELRAQCQSVRIAEGENPLSLEPFRSISNDDFIISEIFFTGTLQPSGNQYNGDDYVKIYNNTDHVLYADGLTLFESRFNTTQKYDYTPDIMAEAMTVDAIYTIPGSGREHPVEPGGFILLADTGIDHRVINPNSFDLSEADFEWYDVSRSPSHLDIDSPTVENLDKWYCYTNSFWVLHNRGFKAYGLARIPEEKAEYLASYRYDYDYTLVTAAGSFPMSQSAYRLPNEWIVDVVNCSVKSEYQWTVCIPALDMGWTHCGTIDADKSRYFHAVRRKMAGKTPDGRIILQDTNNSTEDFNPMVIPSEIERQGTAVNVNGDRCTTKTYDGIHEITD